MRPESLLYPLLLVGLLHPIPAQDGLEMGKMWTFENPPLAYLEKEYGFKPDQRWLNSLRLASLQFGRGCSASFVSPKGLIMTNHHCARDDISKAQGKYDWVKDGFYATSLDAEVKLPGLRVQQLISTRDITTEVHEGVEETESVADQAAKIAANRTKILAAARAERPELSPRIIQMHQGAVYQLYLYRIYDDIRLVCAPHLQTSHFGGDPDNFTYPRFALDFTFCRAYDRNGKPADTSKHYFRWSRSGPQRGELAFVTGNPGSTGRLLTQGQMSYLRDARYPIMLEQFVDELAIVKARAARDPAYEKRVRTTILSRENSRKAVQGYLDGLHDPTLRAAKEKAEAKFRAKVKADAELQRKFGDAWSQLERINERKIELQPILTFYAATPYSSELNRAEAIVRATDPDALAKERDQAARRARVPLRPSQTADALFAAHLRRAQRWLAKKDPFLELLLAGGTPEAAIERIKKSVLSDDDAVSALLKGGRSALEASPDPIMKAALLFTKEHDRASREMDKLKAEETVHGTRIGRALFACYGNDISPDATLSPRFSDGRVQGYAYNGTIAPYRTTFHGLYGRNAAFDNVYPFNLPRVWLDRKDRIDLTKGVNFVATNDIIGGNSGSPIVNQQQEVIGLIFDGNIEMLGNRFLYRDDVPRSVSVHSEAILECMEKIYDARRIVEEIRTGSR